MSRLTLSVVDPEVSLWVDVRLDAETTATVAEVLPHLLSAVRRDQVPAVAGVLPFRRKDQPEQSLEVFVAGKRVSPDQGLAEAGIVDGAVVSVGDPRACVLPEPSGLVEVRISGGPDAGDVIRLSLGEHIIGTAADSTVRIPRGPEQLATLTVGPDGTVTLSPLPGCPAALEGSPLQQGIWAPEHQLRIPDPGGDVVLELTAPGPADAALGLSDDGGLAFNRPPRLAPFHEQLSLTRPKAPEKPGGVHIPWIVAMLPLVLGGVMWFTTRKSGNSLGPAFLLMMLMSPLMLIGNAVGSLRSNRKEYKQKLKQFKTDAAAFDGKVEVARRAEELDRRRDSPDPATVMLVASGPRQDLWERRASDPDALELRIGLADLPSARLEVQGPDGPEPQPISTSVPVTVDLRDSRVIGVAGPRALRAPLARWLILQLATLHSPVELSMTLLSSRPASESAEWDWTRWLPHLRASDGSVRLGLDPEAVTVRAGELVALVEARRQAVRGTGFGSGAHPGSFEPVVVVLDGARDLRRLPGLPTVLADGPAVGVYAICLDDEERLLPEECGAVVTVRSSSRLTLGVSGRAVLHDVLAEGVSARHGERAARAMAPVRDVSRDAEGARLPSASRLLSELGMETPDPHRIAAQWSAGGRTTTALLGVSETGPFTVDMRLDGPHGLIAGTTGSGKSELLQTLIASLAVGNRPDEFTFVLVDYKGGAAFKDCVALPHTVGMVTDLDGHLTTRALESLAAELRRREHQLAGAGAKDIEDYLSQMQPGDDPMPRLLIVIDEFAALVAELPDFVTGLVDIARRGRSLGVHLILATQRPAGVVNNDIKSNTNLRIALRVTDRDDSTDVINSPDAASISKGTPGRAYARLGHSTLVPFQSARVGGRPPIEGESASAMVAATSLDAAARPWSLVRAAAGGDDDSRPSDLATLVATIREAAEIARVAPTPPPWLPALPDAVTMDEFDLPGVVVLGQVPLLPLGMGDVPSEQRRSAETFDLESGGHLVIAGTARSGRSTALRTLAAGVGRFTDPRDVHLYGIDCGNNALLPLLALPHTGAVVSRDQPERLVRLIARLLEEVAKRQQRLAAQGFSDVREQRAAVAPDDRMPYLLVLLDRWEGFLAAYENYDMGRLVDSVHRLLQEGPGVGIKIVIAGDRTALVGKISTLVDDRLVLKMTDPSEYSAVGMSPREVPDSMVPGRGFRSETTRETQIALLDADLAGTAQVAALQRIGREAAERTPQLPRHLRPARVDMLPVATTYEEMLGLLDEPTLPTTALVGVGGDDLTALGLDTADYGPGLLVVGAPKTGRSSTLLTMTHSLLDKGWHAVVLTPRRSPLRDLAETPGVHGVFTLDMPADDLQAALTGAGHPLVLVVDDLELLDPDSMHAGVLDRHMTAIRDSGDVILAGGGVEELAAMYRGPVIALKKSRSGVILAPRSYSDGDLLSARLPREIGGPGPTGAGILVRAGLWQPIQVAAPPVPESSRPRV